MGAKSEFIWCELYLPLAQGTLAKHMQGNYGSFLCIWKSENGSIKSCGGLTTFPAYKRGLPFHEEMQTSWKVSRQVSASCPICPHGPPVTFSWAVVSTGGRERKSRGAGVIGQLLLMVCSSWYVQFVIQARPSRRLSVCSTTHTCGRR